MPDIPDDVRRRAWLDNVRDYVARKAGELGSATVEKAQEVARGYAGNPGTPYGEAMNRVMAAGRSVLPGGESYADELQRVKEAREEEYPGAYSVIPEVRRKALKQSIADDMTSNAMGMASPIAFHGSPHVFQKFDLSKLGTGEGAQAYGHGLYFTSEPKVAEGYRSGLTASKVNSYSPGEEISAHMIRRLRERADALDAQAAAEASPTLRKDHRDTADRARAQAKHLEGYGALDPATAYRMAQDYGINIDDLVNVPQGAFYEVDIPDNLLDYDRGLAEQRPEVIAKLEAAKILPPGTARYLELGRQMEQVGGAPTPKGPNAAAEMAERQAQWNALRDEMKRLDLSNGGRIGFDVDNLDYFMRYRYKGQDIVRDVASDPVEASRLLREAGIPGHRYKGDSSGVENYVIYDDQQIKPLGRFPNLTEYLRSKQSPNQ